MRKKTDEIAVLSTSMFEAGNDYFWISNLERLLEKYPALEMPHKRRFHVILFIQRAQGEAIIDGHHVRLDYPKIICIKPGSILSIELNRTAQGAIICFTEDFFSIRYNNNALSHFLFLEREYGSFFRLTEDKSATWELMINAMNAEYQQQQKGVDSVLRSYLNIILCKLDREFAQTPGTVARKNLHEDKIRQFKALLDSHFITQKTPSFYASRLNITTNYLNKLCKKQEGLSSGELIRRRITIEAQRLLHYTVLPIAEIAQQLEFESVSYFITFFKRSVGITPESFRKSTN